jgi:DNA-binding response OmpR family regulator
MGSNHSGSILVVDDEEAVRFFVSDCLTYEGFAVDEVDSGEAALAALEKRSYALLLLDLRMIGMDGLSVMHEVKQRWPETIIIVMTAYASVDSAIEAMRHGAFDYLRKPCESAEILACVKKALGNSREHKSKRDSEHVARSGRHVETGELAINMNARSVSLSSQPISLTPTEYELLAILAQAPGRPIPLAHLIEEGLGYDPQDPQAQETLRVHISRVRRKIGANYILTVRGGGYLLANISPGN